MIWMIAILYAIVQNVYYGWNFFPKSEGELITDGIALLIFALAMSND